MPQGLNWIQNAAIGSGVFILVAKIARLQMRLRIKVTPMVDAVGCWLVDVVNGVVSKLLGSVKIYGQHGFDEIVDLDVAKLPNVLHNPVDSASASVHGWVVGIMVAVQYCSWLVPLWGWTPFGHNQAMVPPFKDLDSGAPVISLIGVAVLFH